MATDQVDNYFEVYAALYQRLSSLVDADHCHAPVPACPGWRVHDVIAHLAGLCEDWVNHRLDGYASPAWTANQVKRHAHRPCAKIFDVWAEAIRSFALLDETFLGRSPARWAFGDAVIHEADVRGTLAAGRVPDDAVLMGLKGTIARWRETLGKSGAPTLHLRATDARDWWLGVERDPNAVAVAAPMYEVFRALAGRRTADQVRDWGWSGDPEPFIKAGLPYPFSWASDPLVD